MNDPLITRHRPKTFDEVRGNSESVAALHRRVDEPGRPHSYLFTGPSGVGKTTLARIIATHMGAEVLEIDAASNSGVDAMRALVDLGHYMSTTADSRMIVLDECHALSRSAWQAALKILEEPPDHLYLSLCTTELHKVPDTIATRSYHVKLERLKQPEIADLVIEVAGKEGWLETIHDDVLELVIKESTGQPRRALSLLQACYDAPNRAEAQRIIPLQGSSEPLMELLKLLISGKKDWQVVQPLMQQLSDEDFTEGSIIHACRYIIGALSQETSAKRAQYIWELLAAFIYPAHSFDPKASFYGAVGRILWSTV